MYSKQQSCCSHPSDQTEVPCNKTGKGDKCAISDQDDYGDNNKDKDKDSNNDVANGDGSVMDTWIFILIYITCAYLYCLQLLLVTLDSEFVG